MVINSFTIKDIKYLSNLIFAKLGVKKLVFKGKHTYGNPKVIFDSVDYKVRIGKYCSIGKEVTFILSGTHRTDYISTYPLSVFFKDSKATSIISHKGDIHVGNDVWIGYGATILPGVTIGDGAIIGAMSVVTKNVNDYEIVAGNPARVIRKRFQDRDIIKLSKIKWWNWPDSRIRLKAEIISSPNIKDLRV